jgi:hypothetical protein
MSLLFFDLFVLILLIILDLEELRELLEEALLKLLFIFHNLLEVQVEHLSFHLHR